MIITRQTYVAVVVTVVCIILVAAFAIYFRSEILKDDIVVTEVPRVCTQATYTATTDDSSVARCPFQFILEKSGAFIGAGQSVYSNDVQAFNDGLFSVMNGLQIESVGATENIVWNIFYKPSSQTEGCYIRADILKNCAESEVPQDTTEENFNGSTDQTQPIITEPPSAEAIQMFAPQN